MRNPWLAWVALVHHREDATPLAVVRAALALVVVAHLAGMMASGADLLVWVDADHGGLRDLRVPRLDAWGGATVQNIRTVELFCMFSATMLALGALTPLAAVATWASFAFLGDLNSHAGGSYDEVILNGLFLLMLSGCGRALSVDARVFGGDGTAAAWPRYLLIGQIAVVYWSTGLQKVSAGWVPGGQADALWYILQQPTWHRTEMTWLAPYFPLTQLATTLTWLWEQSSPLFLLAYVFRATRTRPGSLRAQLNRIDFRSLFLLGGAAMHLGIELSMEVGPFGWSMVALYAAAFHGDELRAAARRLARGMPLASPVVAHKEAS